MPLNLRNLSLVSSRSSGPKSPPEEPKAPAEPLKSPASEASQSEIGSPRPRGTPYSGIIEDNLPSASLLLEDGTLRVDRPSLTPPFRLHPPSIIASRSPSPAPSRQSFTSDRLEVPSYHSAARSDPTIRPMERSTEAKRLERELRARPLCDSFYGRAIVSLLTMRWVEAPSGLAATCFNVDVAQGYVTDVADFINLLMCGAEAFKDEEAGVLAISGLARLNRFFILSGLSPIVPQQMPSNWPPLCCRQPSDFLLEGFRIRPNLTPSSSQGPK